MNKLHGFLYYLYSIYYLYSNITLVRRNLNIIFNIVGFSAILVFLYSKLAKRNLKFAYGRNLQVRLLLGSCEQQSSFANIRETFKTRKRR